MENQLMCFPLSSSLPLPQPKARSANSTPATNSNYSSLPCCGARTSNLGAASTGNSSTGLASIRTGSCNGERNVLGIDISAVHNAVLRGNLAKLPEPMLNEHPVTIYPGPSAKGGNGESARNKRLLNSVEKHKEVCHMLNPHSNSSTSTSSGSQHTSSSGEASPAASNMNMMTTTSTTTTTTKHHQLHQLHDDYSEDSLEESTISTDLTPVKQNGVAWEIHFKSNRKKTSGSKSKSSNSAAKKVSPKII